MSWPSSLASGEARPAAMPTAARCYCPAARTWRTRGLLMLTSIRVQVHRCGAAG